MNENVRCSYIYTYNSAWQPSIAIVRQFGSPACAGIDDKEVKKADNKSPRQILENQGIYIYIWRPR